MYDIKEHVITCKLTEIQAAEDDVFWSVSSSTGHLTSVTDKYTLDTGENRYTAYAQTSTLTITALEMRTLRGDGLTHIFTCGFTLQGAKNDKTVTATQTITFHQGKKILLQSISLICRYQFEMRLIRLIHDSMSWYSIFRL